MRTKWWIQAACIDVVHLEKMGSVQVIEAVQLEKVDWVKEQHANQKIPPVQMQVHS